MFRKRIKKVFKAVLVHFLYGTLVVSNSMEFWVCMYVCMNLCNIWMYSEVMWRNQEFGNHQRHQQPTTTWSAEKTTVVDDRQNIKSCENEKDVSVKSLTTSRKLGWCSDNLLSSGDFGTELQMLHSKMQTSDQHQKQKDKIRVCKKAQRWARRVLELCLWTDESKINLYLSDGKAKVWRKKGNCKWSQAYSLICKAWWRWRCCHGMGMYGSLWNSLRTAPEHTALTFSLLFAVIIQSNSDISLSNNQIEMLNNGIKMYAKKVL